MTLWLDCFGNAELTTYVADGFEDFGVTEYPRLDTETCPELESDVVLSLL